MKKLLIGSGAIVAGAALATSLVALAQTASSTPSAHLTREVPMVLRVGPRGRVLLRGTIDAVSAGSLTVKSWGGDWTVNVGSNAEVLPAGTNVIEYKDGDYVGVQGTVSQSASWTIDAALVRDWTYRQALNQERRQNIQSVRETIRSGTPRNFQGTATTAPAKTAVGWSWMISIDGVPYTVNVAANAKVVNKNWIAIRLSAIQNGDTVRVWGTNVSGTITAQIVRDVSLPAAGASVNGGTQ